MSIIDKKANRFILVCIICVSPFGLNLSNGPLYGQESNPDLRTLAKEIEVLRNHLEEWGTVTVSQPVVVSDKSAFNLGSDSDFDSTKTYIKGATGVQGGASENSAGYFGSGTDASLSSGTGNVKATATNTGTDNSQQTLSVVTPTPFPSLSPVVSAPVISQREALLLGINDKLTELIMRQMANPREYNSSKYRVDFAIVQISVNPGWRTQQNYVADCSATCYYIDWQNRIPRDSTLPQIETADGKSSPSAPTVTQDNIRYAAAPKVFSVLPLLDAQTLDLQNSESQVTNLIFRVAAQYPGSLGQVNFKQLFQAIKSYARSATSSTALTVTNSYSAGSTFGFRIAPSFTAILNPAARKSGSANRMISTSFPVLVTLVQLKKNVEGVNRYPYIEARLNSRWLIYQRPTFSHWFSRIGLPMHRETESDRFNWTGACAEAERTLEKIDSHYGGEESLSTQALRTDLWSLEAKGIGRATRIDIGTISSRSGQPKITSISQVQKSGGKTDQVPLSSKDQTVILVLGENLVNPGVAVAGPYSTTTVQSVPASNSNGNGEACIVIFPAETPPDEDPNPAPVKLAIYCEAGIAVSDPKIILPAKKGKTTAAPQISDITPNSLPPGVDSITIDGTGFGSTKGSIMIDKKADQGTIQSWNDPKIEYSLSKDALTPGDHSISVSVDSKESNSKLLTILRNPKIDNLEISKDGKLLTLNGSGFGKQQENGDSLQIDEIKIQKITTWNVSKIVFDNLPAPTTLITSDKKVTVKLFLDGNATPAFDQPVNVESEK